MRKRLFAFAVSAAASISAAISIAAVPEDYSGWVQLTASDGSDPTKYSFDNAGNWSDVGNAPSAGKKYYVPVGLLLKCTGTDKEFKGDVLAVAGTLQVGNTGNKTVTYPELRLLPGGIYKHNSNNRIGGKVVIEGTEDNPAYINSFFYPDANVKYIYTCTFEGEKGSAVRLGHASLSDVSYERIYGTVVKLDRDNSLSGFKGKLIVGGETHVDLTTQRHIPGGISVESKGILSASEMTSGNVFIGDLELADGAELVLDFYNCGTVMWNVTNSLAITGSPSIRFEKFDVNAANAKETTIMRLSGPAAANAPEELSKIICKVALSRFSLPKNVSMRIVDNGDGTKDVRCVYDEIVTMRTHNDSYQPANPTGPWSAFDDVYGDSFWSTGAIPSSDFSGAVYCAWYRMMACGWNLHLNYPEMELFTSGSLHMHVKKLTLKHLYVDGCNSNSVSTYAGPYVTEIDTPITFYSGRTLLAGRSGRGLVFLGELDGHTDLVCAHNQQTGMFFVDFRAANTNFSGSVRCTSYLSDYDPDNSVDRSLRVKLNDGRNLGGAYTGSDPWKAVTIENYTCVTAMADVVFSEPTRGLFVNHAARFVVLSGRTLRIDSPVTYGGRFVKLGEGALVLGCAEPGFADNGVQCESPLEGSNVLQIVEGVLKVSATNAVNGLAVQFAAGTSLVVDPCPADADLAAFGAINTRWEVPFSSDADDGSVTVSLETKELPNNAFDVAICTVSAEASASLKFNVSGTVQKRKCEVVQRTNADGTVTFAVKVAAKPAMVISIR